MQLLEPPAGGGQGGPGGGGDQGQCQASEDVQETAEADPQSWSSGKIRFNKEMAIFFLILHRILSWLLKFDPFVIRTSESESLIRAVTSKDFINVPKLTNWQGSFIQLLRSLCSAWRCFKCSWWENAIDVNFIYSEILHWKDSCWIDISGGLTKSEICPPAGRLANSILATFLHFARKEKGKIVSTAE